MSRIRSPKQTRSEETLERILVAAEQLYETRDPVDFSVREICEEANASPSSFYARFSDRDALLTPLFERFHVRTLAVAGKLGAEWEENKPEGSFEEFVRLILDGYTGFFREHARIVETFRQAETDDPALQRRRHDLGRAILRGCLDQGRRHFPEIDWDGIEGQVDGGMGIITAAFRGAASPPEQLGFRVADAPGSIVDGLVDLVLRFVPEGAAPSESRVA